MVLELDTEVSIYSIILIPIRKENLFAFYERVLTKTTNAVEVSSNFTLVARQLKRKLARKKLMTRCCVECKWNLP